MDLREILTRAFPEAAAAAPSGVEISGIETDSRAVQKGFIFIAIRGVKKDGGEFIREALSRGAAAIIADKKPSEPVSGPYLEVPDAREAAAKLASVFYGHPSASLKITGITGTNGKTTSSYILEHLLSRENKSTGVIGTVSYRFAGKEIPASETTPGPLKLQRILSEMRDEKCAYVAMEVSSHALDQKRAAGIDFEAALFTNLTQDHLDYHHTMEEYFAAKLKLFSSLSVGKTAAVNVDDAWGPKIIPQTRGQVVTYAVRAAADFKAENIVFGNDRTDWEMRRGNAVIRVSSPLAGLHNVYNVLGVFAVMHGLGFSVESAAKNLRSFAGVPGRLEEVSGGQDFKVYVDFAHTPDGLFNVLKALQEYRKKKLLVVFGCGGDRDRDKRPKMARIAGELSDFVYVTSDNPRSENPRAIADEICAGFPKDFKNYTVVLDRRKAIRQALLSAREGDVVLLAGKGHERTQIIAGEAFPFSDREEAEKVLNGR